MLVGANNFAFLQLILSETNLKNLNEYHKLVKDGGDPNFPDLVVEVVVESDEAHENRHREMITDIEDDIVPIYLGVFYTSTAQITDEDLEDEWHLAIDVKENYDKGAVDGSEVSHRILGTLKMIEMTRGVRLDEIAEGVFDAYNLSWQPLSKEECLALRDLPYVHPYPPR